MIPIHRPGLTRRAALAASAAGTATLMAPTALRAQGSARPPAELFFDNASFTEAVLSPGGTHVAVVRGTTEFRNALIVMELATGKLTPLARLGEQDIADVRWVNDTRLVFRAYDLRNSLVRSTWTPWLMAVNIDGSRYRVLNQSSWVYPLDVPARREGGMIPVVRWEAQDFGQLWWMDTVSPRIDAVEHPPRANDWLLDGRGELRAVVTHRNDRATLMHRAASGEWRALQDADRYTGQLPEPVAVQPDGQMLVTSGVGRDTLALYRFDPAQGRRDDKPLLALDGFDARPHELVWREDRLVGLRFLADAEVTVWLDPAMKALQAEVDERLGATVNVLTPPLRGDGPHVLVKAYSDVNPARYFVWHRRDKQLTLLGHERPKVKPEQMSPMDFVRYPARDGLSIPAYLTLPQGGPRKNLPLVVLVHGGPWVRGHTWGWDAEVQFLASRGYAVLQPEFRGSTGFGDRHFRAGFKQWGLAMQDDLTDGARWAIAQGVADPKRVAIVGASYGGYAALMGLVKEPALFRCGVCWAGVSDIDLMFSAHWSDAPGVWKEHGMPQMVGDRVKDAEQLRATSPLQQAARIRNPLLIAHGRYDQRVPIEHGRRLHEAVKAHNPAVEYVEYAEEGHGWYDPATNVAWWQRVEAFLARHLA